MGIYSLSKRLAKKPVWSTAELATLMGKSRQVAKVYANRLMKKGILKKAARGMYASTDNVFALAAGFANNSYISFVCALYLRQASEQIPSTVQVVVPKKPRFALEGVEWVRFQPKRVFGFKPISLDGFSVNVAEVEKAVVDICYRPSSSSLQFAYSSLEGCNAQKLGEYAARMGNATLRRVGYLMELRGMPTDLWKKAGSGAISLNPRIKRKGKFNAKWRIYANEVF